VIWPLVKLGELVTIKGGGTPSKKVKEYWSGNIPWASVKDFKSSEISKTVDSITKLGVSNSATNIIPAGTILTATRMALGKFAINTIDMAINQDLKALFINDDTEVDRDFLIRFLESKAQYIDSEGKGATVKGVTLDFLKGLEIPLPTLDEQKRIAAILDKADTIRRKRQQAIQLADDFLRSVFLDMFGDPVTNPKGWKVKKLGELTTIRRGASPRPIANFIGGNVPWIKIGDGSKGDQVYLNSTKVHVTQKGADKSVFLEKGSLIFANCGVSLGFARILNISGCIHDGWLSIENIDKDLNKIFILKWINQLTLYFRRIAPEGTQPNLNSGIMKGQEIILPPIELQNKFEDILFKHEDVLAKLNDGLLSANDSFNSISQKAFAGEL
jgi:restriction endonuclease S subunit